MQLPDRDLLVRADSDDLLGEDVDRIPWNPRLLDRALTHRPRHDGRLEQVGSILGEDPALRDRVERVTRAPDSLQPAGDRLRTLDLYHEIDRAHVDPELERRGRDQAGNFPRFEQLLDQHALLPCERSVVGARDLLVGQFVQA